MENECDVCRIKENKQIISTRKIGGKNVFVRVCLNVCEKHKDFFKYCENTHAIYLKAQELLNEAIKLEKKTK